jgi:parallel beta-helix repeat protein
MTINASSYFRPCDCEGGVIEADTIVYLAPSAAADSPTGVIGSDETGDGTELRPFYSIKRAMEYLENFRIKVGAYVTIRGLPGYYHYNDDHATVFKHKDTKYIKVQFDAFEPGQYLETQVDFNTTVSRDTSNYDSATGEGYVLVTFAVDDIGTGFYQIQPGDYIKMSVEDVDNSNSFERAVWNGFHRVTAVDVTNKKVTVMYKYYKVYSSSYVETIMPDTLATSDVVKVWKLSTHVYVTVDDTNNLYKGNYLYSEYGMNSIQINASCENHYDPINTLTFDEITLIYIYDGVINDVRVNANGFNYGIYFINLLAYWDESDIEKTFSTFTSCNYGLYLSQSKTFIMKITGNNARRPIKITDSSTVTIGSSDTLCSFINCLTGLNVINSVCGTSIGYDYNKKVLICYCSGDGVWTSKSSVLLVGVYVKKCYFGVGGSRSYVTNYYSTTNDLTGKPQTEMVDCHMGYDLYQNSSLRLRNQKIDNIGTYGINVNNSTLTIDTYTSTTSNCNYGIYAINCSFTISHCDVNHNGLYGIFLDSSNGTISNCITNYNSHDGMYIIRSTIKISNCTASNNSYNGILMYSCIGSIVSCTANDNNQGILTYATSSVITYCTTNDNNSSGMFIRDGSFSWIENNNILNNKYGIYVYTKSNIECKNNSSYNISGNTSYNILCTWGSTINVYTDNAISNMSPAPNNEPTWSGRNAGTLIGYTNY